MIKKHYKRFFNNFEKKIRSINNNQQLDQKSKKKSLDLE